MRTGMVLPALIAALATFTLTPAVAAYVPFFGSSFNINPPAAPGAPCPAPLLNLQFGPGNTGGTSNFGSFTYTQAHCAVGGPGPYSGGVFQYFFATGDMLEGTYVGILSGTGTGGLLSNHIDYTVTSGTGLFLNATGTITGDGTLDFRNGPARADLVLDGMLDLATVPEPSALALLFAGLAGIVGLTRRSGGSKAPPLTA